MADNTDSLATTPQSQTQPQRSTKPLLCQKCCFLGILGKGKLKCLYEWRMVPGGKPMGADKNGTKVGTITKCRNFRPYRQGLPKNCLQRKPHPQQTNLMVTKKEEPREAPAEATPTLETTPTLEA